MSPIHIIRFLASFMPSIGKARRADVLLVVLFGMLWITVSLGLAGCGDAAPAAAPALTNTPAPAAAPIPVACGLWPRCSEKFWRTADEPSVRAELDAGAGIEARDDAFGSTPLHQAAGYNGNAEVTGLLIDRGAGIEARTDAGAAPLHMAAAFNDNPEVLRLLRARQSAQ